jgi:Major Facilitator Superfamily
MLTSVSVWALILGYGCQGYAFYVYYNWFYFYAVKLRGLDLMHAAAWTSAPFLAMAVLSPVGGWFSDRVARVSDRRKGRPAAVWLGMGVAALLLYTGNHLSLTVAALPMIALAAGFTMFAAANFWASCIDLAPGYSVVRSDEHHGKYRRSCLIHRDRLDCGSPRLGAGAGRCGMGHDWVRTIVYNGNANRSIEEKGST